MENAQIVQLINSISKDDYKTNQKIAEELSVTARTVQNYVSELRSVLAVHGADIESKPRYGIRLIVTDAEKYSKFIDSLNADNSSTLNSQKERVHYILDYLLVKKDMTIKYDDLCDQLYVSRTTLLNDLKIVKEYLKKYKISLVSIPKKGVQVVGTEFDMRLCIAGYSSNFILSSLNDPKNDYSHYKIKEISELLMKIFEEEDYQVSSVSFQNLVSHMYVTIHRAANNSTAMNISVERIQQFKVQHNHEFGIARRVAEEFSNVFDINMDENEIVYIAIHLAGKKLLNSKKNQNDNIVISAEITQIINNVLQNIYELYNIDLRGDFELRMSLALHLLPLEVRLSYDMEMQNPMLKEIKSRFMLAYSIAVQACSILEVNYQKQITENEIGYFALYFNLALERLKKNTDKKNILVVCSSGRGTAELLAYQLKEEFSQRLGLIETTDVLQLANINLGKYDYLLTTVHIPYPVSIPILEVNYFLDNQDIKNVRKLFQFDSLNSISKYYDKRLFFSNVDLKTKDEVLKYLSKEIAKVKIVPTNFLEMIKIREKQASTEMGNRVAIPHPYKVFGSETFVTIAILKEPILWDKKMVQLVYLICIESSVQKDLQVFYKTSSNLLISKDKVSNIIKKKSFEETMKIIEEVNHELGDV